MKKPVFAMLLGGVLGVFDGLTALISAPETAGHRRHRDRLDDQRRHRRPHHRPGRPAHAVAADRHRRRPRRRRGLAALITIGGPYFWEIVLPGAVVGLIVGYATFKYAERSGSALNYY